MRHRALGWVPAVALPWLLFLAAGCADETPATARDVELSGYVRDEETRRPVSGAEVVFTSDVLDTARTSTDGDGYYEMGVVTNVLSGRVRATAAGYQPGEASVYFDTPSRRVDLQMRKE